jgi:hypothetical protein
MAERPACCASACKSSTSSGGPLDWPDVERERSGRAGAIRGGAMGGRPNMYCGGLNGTKFNRRRSDNVVGNSCTWRAWARQRECSEEAAWLTALHSAEGKKGAGGDGREEPAPAGRVHSSCFKAARGEVRGDGTLDHTKMVTQNTQLVFMYHRLLQIPVEHDLAVLPWSLHQIVIYHVALKLPSRVIALMGFINSCQSSH